MSPLTLIFNAVRAVLHIPRLIIRLIIGLLRGDEDAINILQEELPTLLFVMSPVLYVVAMVIALVAVMTSGAIESEVLQVVLAVICNVWIFVTIALGLQSHDTRLLQARAIQYYLLFLAFVQTLMWVAHPDNPKSEPTSVFILFMATSVAFINESIIKPTIESLEFQSAADIQQQFESDT